MKKNIVYINIKWDATKACKVSIENINTLKYLFLPIIVLIAPVLLVIMQPDLGTSILIAAGGVVVAWLAGVRFKFFAYG